MKFQIGNANASTTTPPKLDFLGQRECRFGAVESTQFTSAVEVLDLNAKLWIWAYACLAQTANGGIHASIRRLKPRITFDRRSYRIIERQRSGLLSVSGRDDRCDADC